MKNKKIILSLVIALILVIIGVTNTYASTQNLFHNFTGLYLKTKNVKMGEKVYVDFYGDTNEIEFVNLELVNKDEDIMLVVGIEDLNTQNPYFVLPEGTISGVTYEMVSVIVKCEHGYTRYSTISGNDNFTNCFENKYLSVEKNEIDVHLTCFSLGSHYTSVKKGEKLWLVAEFKGEVKANFVTMLVKNKENPEMKALVSLKESNNLQYIDVFDIGTQQKLEDGTYYISELYINPNREDYIRYTLNECTDDGRKLDFYVEFEIDAEEDKNVDEIIDNTKDNQEENNTSEQKGNEEIKNEIINNKPENQEENNKNSQKENTEPSQNETINKENHKKETDIIDNIKNNEEDSLNEKIYELLLKIFELLTIIQKNSK